MRSLFAAAALFAAPALVSPAAAQASFGLKAGLNTSFFSGDDAGTSGTAIGETQPRLGLVGGVTARFDVNPGFALQAEALYSQKGDVLNAPEAAGGDLVTRLDYLEVPVTARLGSRLGQTLDGGVSLGGYAAFPLRARVTDDLGEVDDIDARTDYGLVLGLDAGSGPYYVEGRYSLGLAKPIEFDSVLGEDPDLKNQAVSLTFGVRFGGPRIY